MSKVAIIDYGLCNLFSVVSACQHVGLETVVTSNKEEILNADAAILPGVGAFGRAMESIKSLELDIIIDKFIKTGKPFLGICLGLQLLFEKSEEFGETKGLGIFNGVVRKLPDTVKPVPQISWNPIKINSNNSGKDIFKNIKDDEYMYFVHSFYVDPSDKDVVLTETIYDDFKFCSSARKDNVMAFQFHPEKSSTEGLKIYENFKDLIVQENK